MRFPLAELTKPEVRALARRGRSAGGVARGLPGSLLPGGDGQGAVPGAARGLGGRAGRDRHRLAARSSGAHHGFHHFTVGQRKGLGVAAAEPLYVLRTEASANRVVVGSRDELAVDRVAGPRRAPAPAGRRGRRRAAALPLPRRALPRREARGRAPPLAGARTRRAVLRRGAGPVRVPAARRRDRRLGDDHRVAANWWIFPSQVASTRRRSGDAATRHRGRAQRVARCQAATEAASWISLERTIRSTSATANRRAISPCSVCSSACAPAQPGRAPDVDGLIGEAVGEVEAAEVLQRPARRPVSSASSPGPALRPTTAPRPPRALRELPESLTHRVAELLDEPDVLVVERRR